MMMSSTSKQEDAGAGTNHHENFDDSDLENEFYNDSSDEGDELEDLIKPTNAEDPLLTLRVKSFQDVEICVPSSASVASVKHEVRRALNVSQNRYIRLIVRGRLLAPDASTIATFASDGDVLHAVVAPEGQSGGAQALLADAHTLLGGSGSGSLLSRRALRGTGVSLTGQAVRSHNNNDDDDETTEDDDDDDEETGLGHLRSSTNASSSAALIRHRGFDRLRLTLGLRRSQTSILRAYFNPQVDRWVRLNPERSRHLVQGIDDALLRRRIHEEAWIAAQGPGSEFRLNLTGGSGDSFFPASANTTASATSQLFSTAAGPGGGAMVGGARGLTVSVGTDRDFFWGFILGFFVGFLMLLWVWMPTVPHKQKLGILTGISFQLALSMMRSQDDTDDSVLD